MQDLIDEGLNEYLTRAADHKLLTASEELALARRFQAGDDSAREQLILCNLRLVISVAKYYRGRGHPMADIIQDGTLGLDRAARKFDPARGLRFSTYATLWIKQSIQRGLSGGGSSTIRLPPEVASRRAKARAHVLKTGMDLTVEELAQELDADPEHIRQALEAAEVVVSLDREVSGEDSAVQTILDTIADPHAQDPSEGLPVDSAYLYEALDELPEMQRRVLELRFGFDGEQPRSLADVAAELGKSTTYVQSAQRDALRTLRARIDPGLV